MADAIDDQDTRAEAVKRVAGEPEEPKGCSRDSRALTFDDRV
jgi:hypothetical protein